MSTPDGSGGAGDAEGAQELLGRLLRDLSGIVAAGLLTGAVVGGIGGRLAMRIIFLTSPDHVKGLESDDGFVIGRFDLGDTLGLVLLGALLGLLPAFVYAATRRWLPPARRTRMALGAVVGGASAGAVFVHADGIDFHVLEPLWLAVALFVALGVAYPLMFIPIADRWGGASWFQTGKIPAVFVPLLTLALPPFLVAVALGVAARLTLGRTQAMRRLGAMATPGRAILAGAAAVTIFGFWDLGRDIAALT